ncbi:MAG: molybdopterin-binding protein [Caldilineaceae bacterium]
MAILPTGTELVTVEQLQQPGRQLQPGDILEYNSIMLGAQAEEAGCLVTRLPIVADEYAAIRDAVAAALENHDLVAINAGSSAGSEDYTAAIVAELGELQVHGIAIRPGHPVILGTAGGKALVGIPGYPVSAAVTFERIVAPLLYLWQGMQPPSLPKIEATLTRKTLSPLGEDEFMRVTVGRVGERVVATPLGGGAGVLMSLVKADGIVTIPRSLRATTPTTRSPWSCCTRPSALSRPLSSSAATTWRWTCWPINCAAMRLTGRCHRPMWAAWGLLALAG